MFFFISGPAFVVKFYLARRRIPFKTGPTLKGRICFIRAFEELPLLRRKAKIKVAELPCPAMYLQY